jgi:flagellar biosynthesis protein FlhF
MNVKKFTAQTSREALRRVREALGPDAVILSNRATETGVEIMALASEDISSLSQPQEESAAPIMPSFHARAAMQEPVRSTPAYEIPDMHEGMELPRMMPTARNMNNGMNSGINGSLNANISGNLNGNLNANNNFNGGLNPGIQNNHHHAQEQDIRLDKMHHDSLRNDSLRPDPVMGQYGGSDSQNDMAEMMQELRAMRGMMETQLAELAWSATQNRSPQKGLILREMLGAGFSPSLARHVTEKLPELKTEAEALRWLKNILSRNLQTMGNEHEILEKGGVFALVGPTGVGKTTSTAKLAARCVMRHGTDKLALITTDGYRIGGHEQLRIYGKILGVMVHSVKDEADLRIALRELRGKHTVLIDTIGVSQRDNMVAEQVAMLSGAGNNVQRLLCLNATSTGETLSEVVRAYTGTGLAGCIMTKLDEAATIGNVLDVIIRAKLNLYYVSNGQRVPEDLHLADRAYLMDRAFKLKKGNGPYQLQDAELPLIISQMSSLSQSAHNSREVHLG